MFLAVQTFNDKHKKDIKFLFSKLFGELFSVMGFFYYRDIDFLKNNIILFKSEIKKGTNDKNMINDIIEKIEDWDGELDYNKNILIRNTSKTLWEEQKQLLDYINLLPMTLIGVMDSKGDYIYKRKVNVIINFTDEIKFIDFNFELQQQSKQNFYIEEIDNNYNNNLYKIDLGMVIDPEKLHLTILNGAHYLEHLLVYYLKDKISDATKIKQFNGFTTCTGFVSIYIIFEKDIYQDVINSLKQILESPLPEQDGTESVRVAIETYNTEKQFLERADSVLAMQFSYNAELYNDQIDIKFYDELLHNNYKLQYLTLQYSGTDEGKPSDEQIKEFLNIEIKKTSIKFIQKYIDQTPKLKDLYIQDEILLKLPIKKNDIKFSDFIIFLQLNNILYTVWENDIYIVKIPIDKNKLQYIQQKPKTRFINIDQNCFINEKVILMLQRKLNISKDNLYIKRLIQLLQKK